MPEDYESNGCGSGWNAPLVPDTIYFVSIKECCKYHDYAYSVGTTLEDKEKADREFLNNMTRVIKSIDKWYYPTRLALWRAKNYYHMVKWFGGAAFFDKG